MTTVVETLRGKWWKRYTAERRLDEETTKGRERANRSLPVGHSQSYWENIYRFSCPASFPFFWCTCTSFWRIYLSCSSQPDLNRDGLSLPPKPASKFCLCCQKDLFRDFPVTQGAPIRGTPSPCVRTVGNRTSCVMGGRGDNCARPSHSKGHNKVPSPSINSFEPCIQSRLDLQLHEARVSFLTNKI